MRIGLSPITILRFVTRVAVAALVCLPLSAWAQTNLVVNGNFSSPNVGGSWSAYSNGNVSGWTNTSNSDGIEIDSGSAIGGTYSGTSQSAELNGTTWDTISQTVTGLTVGQAYILSWGYGARPSSGVQQTNVLFGGKTVATNSTTGTGSTTTWTANSVTVVATSTSEVLSFVAVNTSSQGGSTSIGNEIADVLLTPALDHLVIQSTGSGLTCTPSTLTINACANASCTLPYTGGATGILNNTGGTVVWPSGSAFTIAAGSSSTTSTLQETVAGSTLLGAGTVSPAPANARTCNFGSPSCTYTSAAAGLLVSMPNHYAYSSWATGSVQAVQQSNTSNACVPAFANVSRNVSISCSTLNPSTIYGWIEAGNVNGTAVSLGENPSTSAACNGTVATLSLPFNANGVAQLYVYESTMGQWGLNVSYTGSASTSDTGLLMSGSTTYITAPYRLALSPQSGTLVAGRNFTVGITPYNAGGYSLAQSLTETPPQIPTLSFTKAKPTGTGSDSGTYTGTLNVVTGGGGGGTSTNSNWNEVGYGDITATLSNYLGSGLAATGTTGSSGAVGLFIPDHFDLTTTASCGSFTYAGQPFAVQITARNAFGATTFNYDGGGALTPAYAQNTTLSAATSIAAGSWGNNAPTASSFALGVAPLNTATLMPSYAFSSKLTAPQTLQVRAIDANGVSSQTGTEGTVALRSGRLRLFNAFGNTGTALSLPAQAEYWSNGAWLLNSLDSCTSVPVTAISRFNPLTSSGSTSGAMNNSMASLSLTGGLGSVLVRPASPAATGSVDIALNFGAASTTAACVGGTVTASTTNGAALPWLRAQYGASSTCATSPNLWVNDPSARATFGVFSSEVQKSLYARELY